jgi:heme/copper-type cytochrome/quinol oxidase subunit 3
MIYIGIPLLNLFILYFSGITLNISLYNLYLNNKFYSFQYLFLTLFLWFLFSLFTIY